MEKWMILSVVVIMIEIQRIPGVTLHVLPISTNCKSAVSIRYVIPCKVA